LLPTLPADKKQRKLLSVFLQLDESAKDSLLDYAGFLLSKSKQDGETDSADIVSADSLQPDMIPRPQQESVIAAIKRLSRTYSMLDKQDMLHETSDLMTSHVIKGRPASEVIDDLEVLFISHYEKRFGSKSSSD